MFLASVEGMGFDGGGTERVDVCEGACVDREDSETTGGAVSDRDRVVVEAEGCWVAGSETGFGSAACER